MALNEIPLQDLHAEAELKQPDLAYEDALADALVKWFKQVYPRDPLYCHPLIPFLLRVFGST